MAILNDTYSEVKVEIENRREDFQVNYIPTLKNYYIFLMVIKNFNSSDVGLFETWI